MRVILVSRHLHATRDFSPLRGTLVNHNRSGSYIRDISGLFLTGYHKTEGHIYQAPCAGKSFRGLLAKRRAIFRERATVRVETSRDAVKLRISDASRLLRSQINPVGENSRINFRRAVRAVKLRILVARDEDCRSTKGYWQFPAGAHGQYRRSYRNYELYRLHDNRRLPYLRCASCRPVSRYGDKHLRLMHRSSDEYESVPEIRSSFFLFFFIFIYIYIFLFLIN